MSDTTTTETPAGGFRDKAHLKAFLTQSGRKYLVLNALDLVEAMTFPEGVELVQQVISMYGQHRATKETGWVHAMPEAFKAKFRQRGMSPPATMTVMVDELPTLEEIDEAIEQLTTLRLAYEARLKSLHARKAD